MLALAEKFLRKSNGYELLYKMYYLLRQTGQVNPDEADIWAVLDRVHTEYPFIDMAERDLPSDTEITHWLLGKLGKQALKRYRAEYAIPGLLEMERSPGDTAEQVVSLDGYSPLLGEADEDSALKAGFLARSAERFADSKQKTAPLE
jgi:hypothetical protein